MTSIKVKQKVFGLPGLLLSLSLTVLITFQNCADPLEFAGEDAIGQDIGIPFAFDVKVDTLSYMSCSNVDLTSFQPRAIYSFRARAHEPDRTGLRLSDAFRNHYTNDDPSRMRSGLINSPANRNASLQMAIRRKLSYQEMLINDDGVIREGFDFSNFLAPLDSDVIVDRLLGLNPGRWIQFFTGVPGLDRRVVEQSIRFIESEVKASQVRNHMMGLGGVDRPTQLTLTYTTDDDDIHRARGPNPAAVNRVYGVGFDMTFRHAHGYTRGSRRGLDSVQEFDLLTGRPVSGVTWDCGRDSQTFIITAVPDFQDPNWMTAGNLPAGCMAPQSDSFFWNTDPSVYAPEHLRVDLETVRYRLALARRVLRTEDWFIDPVGRCVIPKHQFANCYGSPRRDEGEAIANMNPANCTEETCPHFVTVCARSL